MLRVLRAAAESWNSVGLRVHGIGMKDPPDVALAVDADDVNGVVPHLMAWCTDERGRHVHDDRSLRHAGQIESITMTEMRT